MNDEMHSAYWMRKCTSLKLYCPFARCLFECLNCDNDLVILLLTPRYAKLQLPGEEPRIYLLRSHMQYSHKTVRNTTISIAASSAQRFGLELIASHLTNFTGELLVFQGRFKHRASTLIQ